MIFGNACILLGQPGALEVIQASDAIGVVRHLVSVLLNAQRWVLLQFRKVADCWHRIHDGKTQLWNRSGQVAGTEALTAAAQRSDPEAIVFGEETSHCRSRYETSSNMFGRDWQRFPSSMSS